MTCQKNELQLGRILAKAEEFNSVTECQLGRETQ